ncbi:MAG: heme ABC exporter ATP-binding protein CcmA [Pseudomonadota bacterium]
MNGSGKDAKVLNVRVPGVRAEDLACQRGDRLLFRKLSFDLGPGEGLHVTGANGAGKTTLIRAVAQLSMPFAGAVASSMPVALLDERTGLDPDLALGKALDFWFAIDGAADRPAIVERLRLNDLLEVPVRYLSTGQRKRAALARLLGQGQLVWLLDEPLSGLDTASQELVSELVKEHLDGQGVALIASHQPLDVPGLQTLALEDYAPPLEALE